MVECSPATRAARVRFPADATLFCFYYLRCKVKSLYNSCLSFAQRASAVFFVAFLVRIAHNQLFPLAPYICSLIRGGRERVRHLGNVESYGNQFNQENLISHCKNIERASPPGQIICLAYPISHSDSVGSYKHLRSGSNRSLARVLCSSLSPPRQPVSLSAAPGECSLKYWLFFSWSAVFRPFIGSA